MQQDANLDEAEVRTVSDATAALAAAEDGKSIKRGHAEAPAGTAAAAEAQEKTEKEEEIRALIQERKTTAKHEKERIRDISKKIKKNASEKTKGRQDKKKFKRSWKKSKEQATSPVSSRRRSEVFFQKSRTKKVKLSKRDKVLQMYLRNSTKICTKAKKNY